MKKLIALVLSLMMLLPLAACAEAAFPYKAQDVAKTLSDFYTGSIVSDKNGVITVEIEGGWPIEITYNSSGMCNGLSTGMDMNVNATDADEGGEKFGMSGIALLLVSALVESNFDMETVVPQSEEITNGFISLMSDILIENDVLLQYGYDAGTMTICGHPCTLTAGIDPDTLSVSVKLEYLP